MFHTKEQRLTLILIPILSYLLVFEANQVKNTLFSLTFTKLQKLKIWNITQNHCFVFVKPKVILETVKNENQSHGWHAIYSICLVLKTYHFSCSTFEFLFSKSYFVNFRQKVHVIITRDSPVQIGTIFCSKRNREAHILSTDIEVYSRIKIPSRLSTYCLNLVRLMIQSRIQFMGINYF